MTTPDLSRGACENSASDPNMEKLTNILYLGFYNNRPSQPAHASTRQSLGLRVHRESA